MPEMALSPPMTLNELLAAHVTPANRDAVAGAVAAAGPVELTRSHLGDPRAFKHAEHPLESHFEAFCQAATLDTAATWAPGAPAVWEVRELAWALLVERHLVPRLGVEVTLGDGPYNSAYACYVEGLSNNEGCLDDAVVASVTVTGEEVAAAFCDVVAGHRAVRRAVPRPSALRTGLGALVGRRVELRLGGDGAADHVGMLLAVTEDAFVLCDRADDEALVVVPRAAVVALHTYQLTSDEVSALWPNGDDSGRGEGDLDADRPGGTFDEEAPDEEAPDEAELLERLAQVWEQWEVVCASSDPVSSAFALSEFANSFFHYACDRLGFDAVIDTGDDAG